MSRPETTTAKFVCVYPQSRQRVGSGNAHSLLLRPLDVPFLMPGDTDVCGGWVQPSLLALSRRACPWAFQGGCFSAGLAGSPAPAQVGHGQLPGLMTCSLAQPRQHPYWGGWLRISKAGTHTGAAASLILWFFCRGWKSRLETKKLRSFIAASFVSLHCQLKEHVCGESGGLVSSLAPLSPRPLPGTDMLFGKARHLFLTVNT